MQRVIQQMLKIINNLKEKVMEIKDDGDVKFLNEDVKKKDQSSDEEKEEKQQKDEE